MGVEQGLTRVCHLAEAEPAFATIGAKLTEADRLDRDRRLIVIDHACERAKVAPPAWIGVDRDGPEIEGGIVAYQQRGHVEAFALAIVAAVKNLILEFLKRAQPQGQFAFLDEALHRLDFGRLASVGIVEQAALNRAPDGASQLLIGETRLDHRLELGDRRTDQLIRAIARFMLEAVGLHVPNERMARPGPGLRFRPR